MVRRPPEPSGINNTRVSPFDTLRELFPNLKEETPSQRQARDRYEQEEYGCVKDYLDNLFVPTNDKNGNVYSTVGRIQCLLNTYKECGYPIRRTMSSVYRLTGMSRPGSFTLETDGGNIFWSTSSLPKEKFDALFDLANFEDTWAVISHEGMYPDGSPRHPIITELRLNLKLQ